MSAVGKAFKKVRNFAHKLAGTVDPVFKWVHEKTKKIREKIESSPVFKVVAAAVLIYFGGAALISMGSGGTAAAGMSSAWGGVTGAGSAIASGNFAAAGSSIAGGWTGAAAGATAAGATAATSAATSAATTGATTAATTAGTAATTAGTAATTAAEIGGGVWGAGNGVALSEAAGLGAAELGAAGAGSMAGVTTAAAPAAATAAGATAAGATAAGGMTAAEGLLYSAGIQAGTSVIGNVMQGKAAEKAEEEARKRMTYWGVDGEGEGEPLNVGGLLNKIQLAPMSSVTPYGSQVSQPTTLDQLAKTVG